MRDWLIKFLGGYTRGFFEECRKSAFQDLKNHQDVLSNKDLVIAAKTSEIEGLRAQIAELKEDKQKYWDQIFPANQGESRLKGREAQEPLATRTLPWPVMKRRLEKRDADIAAKSQQEARRQVDATEKQIREKNQRVEEKESA